MKIVSVCASPRKNGNTEAIIRSIGDELKKAGESGGKNRYYSLGSMKISPCRACLKCVKKGSCVLSDDFEKLSARMLRSDLIILGSPVYFSDVSAQAKAFIDRTFSLWHRKALQGKKVILVAACAESGSGHTIDTLRHWAREHEMEVVATITGESEEKGKVMRNEHTRGAVGDAVRDLLS